MYYNNEKVLKNNTFLANIVLESIKKTQNPLQTPLQTLFKHDFKDIDECEYIKKCISKISSSFSSTSISSSSSIYSSSSISSSPNIIIKEDNEIKEKDIKEDDEETITNIHFMLNEEKIRENNSKTDESIITNINKIKEMNKIIPKNNIYNIKSDDLLIISNLILLSKLEPNQKICVIEKTDKTGLITFELKIDNSYIPKLSRWYNKQNRRESIKIITKLIDISIKQYNIHKDNNSELEIKKYEETIRKTTTGLKNLKMTYEKDIQTIKEIDNIIEKIEKFINIKE
jgi:hypothetical protein